MHLRNFTWIPGYPKKRWIGKGISLRLQTWRHFGYLHVTFREAYSTQKNTIFSSLEVAENVGNNLHVDHQGADKGCLNVRIVKYPYHPLSQLLTFKTFGDNKAVSLSFG